MNLVLMSGGKGPSIKTDFQEDPAWIHRCFTWWLNNKNMWFDTEKVVLNQKKEKTSDQKKTWGWFQGAKMSKGSRLDFMHVRWN